MTHGPAARRDRTATRSRGGRGHAVVDLDVPPTVPLGVDVDDLLGDLQVQGTGQVTRTTPVSVTHRRPEVARTS
ncbi:hypothetical protein V3W47_12670 [Deinococcus sp. YIM 134068]|uniref:hypothetical protein n=1 Tax=Deinococcus lichenicola TaxID=3118910 RepID=UPI002F9248A1